MYSITKVANPVWGDAAHTQIFCQVAFKEMLGPDLPADTPMPFTATTNDPESHGQRLWKDLIAGKYGPIGAYVPSPPAAQSSAAKPGPHVVA